VCVTIHLLPRFSWPFLKQGPDQVQQWH